MLTELKHQAVKAIRQSYAVLSGEENLSPQNERVNHSLTHLVDTLTRCQQPEVSGYLLETPDLETERRFLPELCGKAECEMEKFWARNLISRTGCQMFEFWYYPEYQELCRAEKELFKKKTFDRISFLGAGALPLTAFLLSADLPDTHFTCVDFDAEACDLAEKLRQKLGLRAIDIRCMDALAYTPGDNELVICASLLQGREKIYQKLKEYDCALMVRDSEGAYQFLYRAAELPEEGFRQVAKTSVNPLRINTSRYYERVMVGSNDNHGD